MDQREKLMRAFEFRHACRAFDPRKQVHDGDVDYVLEAARLSPSSLGLEPWTFVVVRDPRLLWALQSAAGGQPQVGAAGVLIAILARTADLRPGSGYVKTMIGRMGEEGAAIAMPFYEQIAATQDLREWAIAQCHIAAANMMTAAAYIGLDTCPIGGFDARAVMDLLAVDQDRFTPALLIPIGYRAGPQPPRHRLALDSIVEYR